MGLSTQHAQEQAEPKDPESYSRRPAARTRRSPLAFDRPFGDRRGGVAGPGADRYLRTFFRSSPVSRATSDKLIAPDFQRTPERCSFKYRCGSRTTSTPCRHFSPSKQQCRAGVARYQQLSLFIRTQKRSRVRRHRVRYEMRTDLHLGLLPSASSAENDSAPHFEMINQASARWPRRWVALPGQRAGGTISSMLVSWRCAFG